MHLYGKYGGVLLITVAQEGNSNILPVAFVIVETPWGKQYLINAGYEWYMDALRTLSREMADWASRFNKKIWLQHCDCGCWFAYMKTNISGYINAVLKITRYLPISTIVRCTYERLQQLFVQKNRVAHA
ncbi:hypothetical protein Ahy_B09g096857 [Arachis hypogaea]|uniref:MULE transposase domain-containing protein n=1 Tax=Arachis hypogaea TaxID=3818 RepID=A0A444XMV0_ARAHY|nr:hypothetical protein Ahy_B09g096857 [Arachis hypogaea]